MLKNSDAFAHPDYEGSRMTAARRARETPGACFTVYWDGIAVYVRASEAAPPRNSKAVCIAQHWDDKTVQLRFDGAWSEWVSI